MRVPLEWLREYCDPDLDVDAIEERLTMTGTNVEAFLEHGVSAAERFVVGRVLSVQPHPNADRLRVCEVDLGPGRPARPAHPARPADLAHPAHPANSADSARPEGLASIVCGAPNVAAGQVVAVALPGAVMPDGTKLKAAKLRGVPSEGMILAEDELAIGPGHEGILVLDALAEQGALAPGAALHPGAPLADVLPLATAVLELEITPNRPDCLGVYGVARELHAATGAPLASAPWRAEEHRQDAVRTRGTGEIEGLRVSVECPDLCPRFTVRAFDGVRIAPSPPWLKARLTAAGQRPINNLVDITNYAMLLGGQPLHAFDLERVAGGRLTVRRAREEERIVTLDGHERLLDAGMVVIEDAEGPTSLAGVMGGSRSEVQDDTSAVALEVASWHGPTIHRASWTLGLRSEASARFEKGLPPEQCDSALELASAMIEELCGGRRRTGTIDVCEPLPDSPRIRLRSSRVEAILGVPVPRERQERILTALDFDVSTLDGGEEQDAPNGELEVIVPPLRRADVTREADLIEEVARIDGLERLPARLPARRGAYGRLSSEQRIRRRIVDALVGRGLYEAVGWTFASPSVAERLRLGEHDPRRALAVALQNPLSDEQSLLRTMLLPSLLEAAARNAARGAGDLALFEVGTVFMRAQDGAAFQDGVDRARVVVQTGVRERRSLALLLRGALHAPTWTVPQPPRADFFAAKALLEMLGELVGLELECEAGALPFLHPGRSASVTTQDVEVGWIGELHPEVIERFELDQSSGGAAGSALPAALELDLDALLALAPEQTSYRDLISFPELRQDLAVTLPQDVPAAAALHAVRQAGGSCLHDARVFDVYTGPQVGERRRSLALALSFRGSERTLSEQDVEPARRRIVAALSELGGELRG
ncbi:MAG: phenylalanine--tRNA ligase subunit beta [Solirubrobacteraceae bacterium]